jgi:hypothetical protein
MFKLYKMVEHIVFVSANHPNVQRRWLKVAKSILLNYCNEFHLAGLTVPLEPYWKELQIHIQRVRTPSQDGGQAAMAFSILHSVICMVCLYLF